MPGKNYCELEIAFNGDNYELIYNTLYSFGITSILEDEGILKISLPEEQSNLLEQIRSNLIDDQVIKSNDAVISEFDNLDWNKEWENTIEPVCIKAKIIIYPSWKKDQLENVKNKILIEIDPKMSFGTGHNETTQLILEMMCDYIDTKDKFLLDFGCGTGILAIAAIKLGASSAIAIDTDEDSIENAKEYIKINKTETNIKLYRSGINEIHESGFDAICTNITSGVIIENLGTMYDKLISGGKLFITGILNDETEQIENAIRANGFTLKDDRKKEEWAGFYCIKF